MPIIRTGLVIILTIRLSGDNAVLCSHDYDLILAIIIDDRGQPMTNGYSFYNPSYNDWPSVLAMDHCDMPAFLAT